ncbi:unnamed protein product [Aureobasidium uvarum]|uniref:Uncharacterized protein n=1 Tax=Aureobasidium uvarum TaxID=2773716 RepID=A0A9N8KFL3_9PEZI|nr:unnamed protein product [Aureobasidium uvarum]
MKSGVQVDSYNKIAFAMAAAKLCCTAPLRSQSPDDTPPRPVRHFKSLANIKTHFAHNKHAPATTEQTEGSHSLYPADDLELRHIFVAASLPEDHPHALRIAHRKPEVDESIVHSPSLTNKLRRQLSRKTLTTDKPHKETTIKPFAYSRKRLGHGRPDLAGDYDDDARSLCLNESRLASLKNDSCVTKDTKSVSPESVYHYAIVSDEPRRSISVPLASYPADSASQPRRSISVSNMQQDFKGALTIHLPGPTFTDADDIWPSSPAAAKTDPTQSFKTPNSAGSQMPNSRLSSQDSSLPQLVRAKSRSPDKHKMFPKDSANSLHLYDMQISQHLRTRSQVSEASSANESDTQNRHTHASLNSIVLSSIELGRCKSISSSGFAGSAGLSTWEKVLEDESSSIYSRRPSLVLESPLEAPVTHSADTSEKTIQGDAKTNDIPELTNQGKESTSRQAERVISASTGISFVASGSASHCDLKDSASMSGSVCVSSWVGCNTTCSLTKSNSSGSLGKLSKFREDLNDSSTVPKSGKKRRSVLRILFPKLTRSKLRSTSTPLLGGRTKSSLNQTPGRKATEETLMERALLQHQAEKAALLRTSSQRNEAVPSPTYAPVFTSSFGFQSTSETRLAAATLEDVDPLEPEEPMTARESQSMQDLESSKDTAVDASSFRKKKRSTIWTTNTIDTKAARNRRSSTATGGRLEHPELEVLPPMLPTHPTSSQHLGVKNQFARLVDHIGEESHHISEEGLDLINRHRQESTSSVDKSPAGHVPPVFFMHGGSQIMRNQEAGDLEARNDSEDKSALPGSVDGNIEGRPSEPDRALSARRLSRMYQAYVQLPASLDNTEVEQSGAADDTGHLPDGPTAVGPAEIDSKTPTTGFLTVPSGKQSVSSSPVTRHFPSVTVVDDRKGHWRSVSLLSVDSGKSVRKSTKDLLEVVRATQTQELEKLLGTSELSMMDGSTL